jgi:DNA-binding XRE family transcriptional regulator
MQGYTRWADVRARYIEAAGGEEAFEAGKQELLAQVVGHRLAEVRRARGLTQEHVAERMGVTKGRESQIEQGKVAGAGGRGPLRRGPGWTPAPGHLLRRR